MKEIIQGFYQKKHFWTRLILVIAAVILMGFALSWLLLVDLGTDPCTLLNQTISTRLGISIGNWQALFNTVLLIFVIIFGGRNLGFGTLANMFLVGYSIDFFSCSYRRVKIFSRCSSAFRAQKMTSANPLRISRCVSSFAYPISSNGSFLKYFSASSIEISLFFTFSNTSLASKTFTSFFFFPFSFTPTYDAT